MNKIQKTALISGVIICMGIAFLGKEVLSDINKTISSISDYQKPTVVIGRDIVMSFGGKKYSVMGTEQCPVGFLSETVAHDCINLIPGETKVVYLRPLETKDAAYKGVIVISGTKENARINLASILYPDGKAQSFSPFLLGKLVELNPGEKK
jgi:hypothetical protein